MSTENVTLLPRLLTVKDAALYVALPRSTIYEYLSNGVLNRITHGQRRTLIKREELDALADRMAAGEFSEAA
ncbi:MAG: helix-turn-helix domain-containing protein [Cognatishimia activa]